jgi:hypothetical protein
MKAQNAFIKAILVLLAIVAILFFSIIVDYLILDPALQKKMVLSANIPGSSSTVELWERPSSFLPIFQEYETWFVYKTSSAEESWHIIDDQYITFRTVSVLISTDYEDIRVETTGIGYPSHMIAEYNLTRHEFKARSETTVRGEEGWIVIKEQVVR